MSIIRDNCSERKKYHKFCMNSLFSLSQRLETACLHSLILALMHITLTFFSVDYVSFPKNLETFVSCADAFLIRCGKKRQSLDKHQNKKESEKEIVSKK